MPLREFVMAKASAYIARWLARHREEIGDWRCKFLWGEDEFDVQLVLIWQLPSAMQYMNYWTRSFDSRRFETERRMRYALRTSLPKALGSIRAGAHGEGVQDAPA